MRFQLFITSAAILILSYSAVSADSKWPALPTHGFIKGRAAHKTDVDKGDASFILDAGGVVVGKPLKIAIPQYGCFRNPKTPVIVIQAEVAPNGFKFIGAKTLRGKNMVGLLDDIDLLGSKPNGRCNGT